MAYALVANQKAAGNDTTSISAINTSSADLLIVCAATVGTCPTPSDLVGGLGNTWAKVVERQQGNGFNSTIWSVENPTNKGASHVVTITGTDIFLSFQVYAFSGSKTSAAAQDQTNNDITVGATTVLPGPVTPTVDDELVVTHGMHNQTTGTINDSFTSPAGAGNGYGDAPSPGTFLGGHSAYKILSGGSGVGVDPTWTTNTGTNWAGTIATFKPAPAAADLNVLIGEPICGSSPLSA